MDLPVLRGLEGSQGTLHEVGELKVQSTQIRSAWFINRYCDSIPFKRNMQLFFLHSHYISWLGRVPHIPYLKYAVVHRNHSCLVFILSYLHQLKEHQFFRLRVTGWD